MWIYCLLNYARTAIIIWLVGGLVWTESHIPVVLVSVTLGSLAHSPLLQLQSRSLGFTQTLNFGSPLHGEKLQTWDFVTKSSTPEMVPPCWAARNGPWGSAAPWQSKMLDLKVTLSWKAQEILSHWKKTRKRNREIIVFEYFWNCFLR